MSSSGRKSRLAGAMQKKALLPEDGPADTPPGDTVQTGEAEERTNSRTNTPSLTLAPPPAEAVEEDPEENTGDVAEEHTGEAAPEESPSSPPVVTADDESEVGLAPPAETVDAPAETEPEQSAPPKRTRASTAAKKSAPGTASQKAPTQTARVRAGVGQVDLSPEMVHLRKVMDNGRDQRRYVEDLPRRSDKGTYMRLPIHLQDALAEYCDRNTAPMADFIAAVLDAYFRDIGLLPPLGEGHRPDEEFLDRLRKESRTYDY